MDQSTALRLLGVSHAAIRACIEAPDLTTARARLEQLQERTRENYSHIARVLYEHGHHVQLAALTEALDQLDAVRFSGHLPTSLRSGKAA